MMKSTNLVRILSLMLVTVFGTSCIVHPSCLDLAFASSPPKSEAIVVLSVHAEPVSDPLNRRYSPGAAMWQKFEHQTSMIVNTKGRMRISVLDRLPDRCPTVPQEDLAEVSRYWKPILTQVFGPRTLVMMMANPYTWKDDWVPEGPVVELTYGTVSGETIALMWDGESDLPEELDIAVMGTLEMLCSNSRLAKTYLFRDLPRKTTSRLTCQ